MMAVEEGRELGGGFGDPVSCSVEPLGLLLYQGDPCYWDAIIANDCADNIRSPSAGQDCGACWGAGGDTCASTDCGAYLDCLSENCGGCEDEYMYLFICNDNYYQCKQAGVECSVDGDNIMDHGFRRGLRIDHHHHQGRRLGKRRKGVKNPGSKPK